MTKLFSKSNYTKAEIAGIVLVATIWGERLLYYVRSVLLRLPLVGSISKPFITITIIAVIVFTFGYVKKKIRGFDLAFVVLAFSVYFIHIGFYSSNEKYLLELLPKFLTICLPMFLLGVVIDIDKCINVLIKVSLVYVILGVLYYYYVTFVVGTYEMDTETDQMGLAYQYLPHVLLLLYATITRFKVWYLAGFLLGVFMILGTGNRGSLLLTVIFAAFVFFAGMKGNKTVKITGVVIAVLLALNIESIALFFSDIMGDYGLSVRSINYFLQGEIADSNGRDELNRAIIPAIMDSPFLGYGLAGDRVLLGGYCHNILFELIMSFGLLLGILVFCAIVALLISGFKSCTTSDQKGFFFLLLCCGFLQLFMSNSFLEERHFYFLLGYCLMVIRKKQLSKLNEKYENSDMHIQSFNNSTVYHILPEER